MQIRVTDPALSTRLRCRLHAERGKLTERRGEPEGGREGGLSERAGQTKIARFNLKILRTLMKSSQDIEIRFHFSLYY